MVIALLLVATNSFTDNELPGPLLFLLLSERLDHQTAIVGPLVEAQVSAFRLESLDQPLEPPVTSLLSHNLNAAGTFDLSLTSVAKTEWIVVEVDQGKDIDHNGDGRIDPQTTANLGTLHALARAGDWRSKHLRVTPLTELAWRFAENLISAVSPEDLEIRLGDIARYLVKSDIDGNGVVDWYDILAFDPANPSHRNRLATNYDWLSTNDANGHSIIQSLLAGNEEQMLSCMDERYTWLMTRFPVPDSRYSSVKLTLSVFGPGSASSGTPSSLSVNSTLDEPVYEDRLYLPKNKTTMVSFTAVPAAEARILSWTGCEIVSSDLSQCTVSLGRSRSVVANFGHTTTTLNGIVHDLTCTNNTLGPNTVTVQIPYDMTDMITEMATAAVGDFVVGDDDEGFLCKITGITQISPLYYELTTEEASLENVIQQGTGQLYKQMENGDLEEYIAPAMAGQSATVSAQAFTGLEGVRLIPSSDPHDRTFTLILGEPVADNSTGILPQATISEEAVVTLYDNDEGGTLTAKGSISLDIALDTGVDLGFYRCGWWCYGFGLKSFKFITIVNVEESVELTASTKLKFDPVEKKIGTLQFSKIKFLIGPLPVWVTPTVDIILFADGEIEARLTTGVTFEQRLEGGLKYNRNRGFSIHRGFSMDYDYTLPTTTVSALLKGGLRAEIGLKIYDATGPIIPLDAYLKLNTSLSTELLAYGCSDVFLEFLVGTEASFKWDIGSKKIGILHLKGKIQEDIFTQEWPIKQWVLDESCPVVEPSYLLLEGNGIKETIDEGSWDDLATTLIIKNTGDETLIWNTSGIPPEVTISPSSGVVAKHGQVSVEMTLATQDLPPGTYQHQVLFYNVASVDTGLPDEQFGNTYKTIDVIVNDIITDLPSITSATSPEVGKVILDWNFTAYGSDPLVGFQIYATNESTSSYEFIQIIDNINDRQAVISGLAPDSIYSFKMRVYSNQAVNTGPFSDERSVQVKGDTPFIFETVVSAGQVWIDRNLGASRVAMDIEDSKAFGDLYQWGRFADGHQLRTSPTTSELSTTDVPGHASFITPSESPVDWRIPQNDTLWQGALGTNNPCPAGFRLPTATELQTEVNSFDYDTPFFSPLKLVYAGYRTSDNQFFQYSHVGRYWSSTIAGSNVLVSLLAKYESGITVNYRAAGQSIRCIQD